MNATATTHVFGKWKRKYEAVSPELWHVDMSYQRETDTRRIERMVKDFRPELIGVCVLSKRADGRYFTVDGWHRRMAAVTAKRTDPIMCLILSGMTVEEEAKLFHDLTDKNNRRNHTADGAFKARLRFGEPVATDMQRIAKRHGKTFARNKTTSTIASVAKSEMAYRMGVLDPVLKVLGDWAPDQTATYDGPIIAYVAYFIEHYRERVDLELFARRLRGGAGRLDPPTTPRILMSLVRQEKKEYGVIAARAAINVLRRIYNKKTKRTEQLPMPDEIDER